jgi:hypothetical protein
MTMTDAIAFYSSLSDDEKLEFLLHLSHELTIVARDTYAVGSEEVVHPARLRALNEIQHRLLAHARALHSKDPERYPEDVLMNWILGDETDPVLHQQLCSTFARAATVGVQ